MLPDKPTFVPVELMTGAILISEEEDDRARCQSESLQLWIKNTVTVEYTAY